MLPLQCGLFGRALPRPTKLNKNFSLVILNNKFDGACVQARETRALHAARYQTCTL